MAEKATQTVETPLYVISVKTKDKDGTALQIASSLQSVYKKHGKYFSDLESFTAAIIGNDIAQKMIGIAVREATAKDREDFAHDLHIYSAIENINDAKAVMAETIRKNTIIVLKYADENLTTAEEIVEFVTAQGLRKDTLHTWAKWRANDHKMSEQFINAYAQYVRNGQPEKKKSTLISLVNGFYS